jgi:hypothetical protein
VIKVLSRLFGLVGTTCSQSTLWLALFARCGAVEEDATLDISEQCSLPRWSFHLLLACRIL